MSFTKFRSVCGSVYKCNDCGFEKIIIENVYSATDLHCKLLHVCPKEFAFIVRYRGMVKDYVSVNAEDAANKFMMEFDLQVGDGLIVECEDGLKKMYKIARSAKLMEKLK